MVSRSRPLSLPPYQILRKRSRKGRKSTARGATGDSHSEGDTDRQTWKSKSTLRTRVAEQEPRCNSTSMLKQNSKAMKHLMPRQLAGPAASDPPYALVTRPTDPDSDIPSYGALPLSVHHITSIFLFFCPFNLHAPEQYSIANPTGFPLSALTQVLFLYSKRRRGSTSLVRHAQLASDSGCWHHSCRASFKIRNWVNRTMGNAIEVILVGGMYKLEVN